MIIRQEHYEEGCEVEMGTATVGFDLDMTLIDSRRAILGSFAAVGAEKGVAIDPVDVDRRLGIKLEDELIHWFGPADIPAAVAIYRRHYAELAGERTLIMPGAREALAAVRAAGGRAVVITAKYVVPAKAALDGVGLDPDELYTDAHGPEKAVVLSRLGAGAYVGDTPPDMAAAVSAGVTAVGVTTGSFDAAALTAAGADVVLPSLLEFPAWHEAWSGSPRGGAWPALAADRFTGGPRPRSRRRRGGARGAAIPRRSGAAGGR
jgi:phosphoglycolate phosphatase